MVTDPGILFRALNDDTVLKEHIDEIDAIVKEYPFFQAGWAASTRYLKLSNTFIAPRLQQTAARSIDRSLLFEYINKEQAPKQISFQPEKPKSPVKAIRDPLVTKALTSNKKEETKETKEKKGTVKIVKPIPRLITKAIPKKPEKIPVQKEEKPFVTKANQKEIPKEKWLAVGKDKKPVKPVKTKEPEIVVDLEALNKLNAAKKEKDSLKKNIEPDVKLSYTEWVQRFKTTKKQKNKSNLDLIEKFLKERPKIVPKKHVSVKPPGIIEQSVSEKQMLMTETLANLYVKQQKYEKAIQAFRILSLKYPKKSSYFANQIDELKQKLK